MRKDFLGCSRVAKGSQALRPLSQALTGFTTVARGVCTEAVTYLKRPSFPSFCKPRPRPPHTPLDLSLRDVFAPVSFASVLSTPLQPKGYPLLVTPGDWFHFRRFCCGKFFKFYLYSFALFRLAVLTYVSGGKGHRLVPLSENSACPGPARARVPPGRFPGAPLQEAWEFGWTMGAGSPVRGRRSGCGLV